MDMDFLVDDERQPCVNNKPPWKIAIIDDEPLVHSVTKMALSQLEVDNKSLTFLSAYDGSEGLALFEQHDDIALAFVDVVMESESAGLELIDKVRHELHNHTTRIILRTGQPGQAPEEEVIRDYDINDYKSKTDLTSIRLKSCTYSAIRSYRDIKVIEQSQLGMESVIQSSAYILKNNSLTEFANAVLAQTLRLLNIEPSALYITSHFSDLYKDGHINILATTGELVEITNVEEQTTIDCIPEVFQRLMKHAIECKEHLILEDVFVGYYETNPDTFCVLFLKHDATLTDLQIKILEMFAANVALMYENLTAKDDILQTQKELILIMGDAIEARSKETGAHVRRVALMCEFIAQKMNMSDEFIDTIRFSAPLHDVGKIAIPESILHKPAKLDEQEWQRMMTHAKRGYELLEHSNRIIAKMGARIALNHHEHWDGNGYPNGTKGEDIPIEGRIMAVIDVIDALLSKRSYKQPWPKDEVALYLQEQAGKQFAPDIVALCINYFDELIEIRQQFPDE